jgi:hypothetical protein
MLFPQENSIVRGKISRLIHVDSEHGDLNGVFSPKIVYDLYPVRESLGGFLLRNGMYPEAEKVFRADLERNRRSGRSLFGLMESLKAQKKSQAAVAVQREFEQAWKNADTKLSVANL